MERRPHPWLHPCDPALSPATVAEVLARPHCGKRKRRRLRETGSRGESSRIRGMATTMVFRTLAAPFLLLFFIAVVTPTSIAGTAATVTPPESSTTASAGAGAANDYAVEGRVKVEGMGARSFPSKAANIRVIWNGGEKVTYVRPDGYFAFASVKAGTHLLEVSALGYYFSPVRVDVSARLHGQVRALAVETRRYYADALVLEPIREEVYYEKREPFSAMSLLKSPMGLMVGFMVVAIFLLPKLMDSIDPEEMKRVQEEMRNQPAPSFSSLLQGARS